MTKSKSKNKQIKKQQIPTLIGNGGYYANAVVPFMRKVAPRGTFANAGESIGSAFGNATGLSSLGNLGGKAGGYLGGKLASLLGFGEYSVQNNSLLKSGMKLSEGVEIPAFHNSGHETCVRHREYVMDIVVPAVPTAFNNTSFKINPASPVLFPWLANIAASYQQYKFTGLVFEFKSLSSEYVAGGSMGSVILATDYDTINVPFATKLAMENSEYAVSAKPSLSQMHAVECAPAETANNLYYTRNPTASTATYDTRFYDLGNFQIATAGLPATAGTVLGELWVTYDVCLYKPLISGTLGVGSQQLVASGAVSNTSFLGTSPSSTGDSIASGNQNTLTFVGPGTYLVAMQVTGLTVSQPALSGSANVYAIVDATVAGTTVTSTYVYKVKTTGVGQTVSFNWTTSGSITATKVQIVSADISNF
jgi:hypothetical protein